MRVKYIIRTLVCASFVAFVLSLAASCEKKLEYDRPGPVTFEVDVTEGETGAADNPIPFSRDPIPFTLSVRAIDKDGAPADWFDGKVHVRIEPSGEFPVSQITEFEMSGGKAEGIAVNVRDLHGKAAIWVEDIGDDETPGSYATGLSPVIFARNPTVRNVQEVDAGKYLTCELKGDFVEIDFEDRVALVTGVMSDGFYMTDVSEPGFAFSSLFVYSHSYPGVEVGDRIVQLNGTVDEFYGFTELGFPSWKVEGSAQAPDPIQITAEIVDDDDIMEQYESALVEVTDVTICPTGDDFATYGQWAVLVDPSASCTGAVGKINVVSTYTIPDFYPPDHAGEMLKSVKGDLRYHAGADPSWIMYARFSADVDLGDE